MTTISLTWVLYFSHTPKQRRSPHREEQTTAWGVIVHSNNTKQGNFELVLWNNNRLDAGCLEPDKGSKYWL